MKTKTESPRDKMRKQVLFKLQQKLNALIVIDGATKAHIMNTFHNHDKTLSKMKLTEKKWSALGNEQLWKTYNELEEQFKMLNIFSDKFFSILHTAYFELAQVHNPYNKF